MDSNLLYKSPKSVLVSIMSLCDGPKPSPGQGLVFVSIPIASLVLT